MVRTRLLLVCMAAAMHVARAQPEDAPTVAGLWAQAHDVSLRVAERLAAYDQLGWDHYLSTSADSAELVADAMLALADSARAHPEAVMALRLKAVARSDRGDLAGAIAEAGKALARCERHGLADRLPGVYTSLGIFHNQIGDLGQAMAFHTRALQAYERVGDGAGMAGALNNLGFVHYDARDTLQALASFQRAVHIRDSLGIGDMNVNTLGNMGGVLLDRRRPGEALPYLEQALAIAERTNDPAGQARALSNLGTAYKQLGDRKAALDHLARSNTLAREVGMLGVEVVNLLAMAELSSDAGDQRGARSDALLAHELAAGLGDVYLQESAALRLYTLFKEAGDAPRALVYHEEVLVLRDSLANDRSRSEVMRQQARYEFEKREALLQAEQEKKDALARAELRRREQQRNASIAALLALAVVAAVIARQRVRIGREKRRSEELLLNILPEEVADELKEKGAADAKHFDRATILFTDFKGFTRLSEQVSPAELVAELNICFKAFDAIVAKHGIEKIKTIGDAYMAAGGLPDPEHGSPVEVVLAALEMQEFMRAYQAERGTAGRPFFEMRVGIHTGPVVAGIVGDRKFQYDIWGDTVNTASRMESSGEVGQVNISGATHALVKDEPGLTFTSRGRVEAKGKGELEMFFVRRSLGEG